MHIKIFKLWKLDFITSHGFVCKVDILTHVLVFSLFNDIASFLYEHFCSLYLIVCIFLINKAMAMSIFNHSQQLGTNVFTFFWINHLFNDLTYKFNIYISCLTQVVMNITNQLNMNLIHVIYCKVSQGYYCRMYENYHNKKIIQHAQKLKQIIHTRLNVCPFTPKR